MGLSDLVSEILGIPEPSARFLVALYGGESKRHGWVHVERGYAHYVCAAQAAASLHVRPMAIDSTTNIQRQ